MRAVSVDDALWINTSFNASMFWAQPSKHSRRVDRYRWLKFRAVASIDSTRERLALQPCLDSVADDEQQGNIDPSAVQAALQRSARRLLTSTNLRMGEVAFLLGFEEVNSFMRAFRVWEGTTPAKWRGRVDVRRDGRQRGRSLRTPRLYTYSTVG